MTDTKKINLAAMIDHTLLKADATSGQIRVLCDEAIEYGFHCVCVNPRWIHFAADELSGSGVKIATVAGFPLGAELTKVKLLQVQEAIKAGADEIDMVADIASIIEGNSKYLSSQLQAAARVCHSNSPAVTLKVIIEAGALTDEQKIFTCRIASECGVDFVKTSTGFHPAGGATVEDVRLMKEYSPNCRVKAAGGIKTAQQAIAMIEAGADRIGASCSASIMKELEGQR